MQPIDELTGLAPPKKNGHENFGCQTPKPTSDEIKARCLHQILLWRKNKSFKMFKEKIRVVIATFEVSQSFIMVAPLQVSQCSQLTKSASQGSRRLFARLHLSNWPSLHAPSRAGWKCLGRRPDAMDGLWCDTHRISRKNAPQIFEPSVETCWNLFNSICLTQLMLGQCLDST